MLIKEELIKKLREHLDKEYGETHRERIQLEMKNSGYGFLTASISKLIGKEEAINDVLCEITFLERHKEENNE